ncbi:MAG: hypothetical protein CME00_07690 [Geminicoccus sp.]|nr:hypothetical protein [Geminicoccus sp.]
MAALVLVRGQRRFLFGGNLSRRVRVGDLKAAKRRQIERATLTFHAGAAGREAAQAQARNLRHLLKRQSPFTGAEKHQPAPTKFPSDTPVTLRRKNRATDMFGWVSHSAARARRG